jgi:hypothetical protein
MLAELVRVTKPGGRIGAIVRATDMPSWVSPPLSGAVEAKRISPPAAAPTRQGAPIRASISAFTQPD